MEKDLVSWVAVFKVFVYVQPYLGGNDPIWLGNIFEMGGSTTN